MKIEPHKYLCCGVVARLSSTQLEISELPINVWTQNYKESVLELLLQGGEKVPPFIQEYREYHTDTTVKFIVTLSQEKMLEAERIGIHKKFKLETTISTSKLNIHRMPTIRANITYKQLLYTYKSPIDLLATFQ